VKKLMNRRLAAVAVLATLLASTGLAQAASKTCTVGFAPPTCTTGWVRANASGHFVHVSVTSWQTWKVTDIDTHVRVAHGTNGVLGSSRTITGLYGRYNATISNQVTAVVLGGRITISND
jgi:hypothetical protein